MAAADVNRGRDAQRPSEIPRSGWKDIAYRVKADIGRNNLSITAAGVAFYGFLGIFPALAALVSIYGLVTDPTSLQQHLDSLRSLLPAEAYRLISDELKRITQSHRTDLGWSLVGGTVLALWSSSKGMSSLFTALNIVYGEEEKREFLKLSSLALTLTLAAVLLVILFLFVIVGLPLLLNYVPLGDSATILINVARWPLLAGTGLVAMAALYRYGPSRDEAKWQWVSWGAALATMLWLIGSVLFSLYASNFGNYNSTYGSLGVVVVLLTWLLLSAYCVLLGAQINAEMEHQIGEDSTEGAAEPMGQRGAYVADNLGPSRW